MHDLIKVNYDAERPTVLARDLGEILNACNTFEEFFIAVSKIKVSSDKDFLKALLDDVRKYVFKYSPEAIAYLCDTISADIVLPCNNPYAPHATERDIQNFVVDNFSYIFPKCNLVGIEIIVDGIGRIDVLGKDETGRPIVIEIKKGSHNPNKQLIAYGSKYENPVLIAITENPIGNRAIDGITYFTFKEVFEKGDRCERTADF